MLFHRFVLDLLSYLVHLSKNSFSCGVKPDVLQIPTGRKKITETKRKRERERISQYDCIQRQTNIFLRACGYSLLIESTAKKKLISPFFAS